MDFVYVNILNKGVIPYIREKGPIFGYRMPRGVYSILSRDPRIIMRVTTLADAEKEREAYYKRLQSQNSNALSETVKTEEKVTVNVINLNNNIPEKELSPVVTANEINEIIEEDLKNNPINIDDEIDNILSEAPEQESAMKVSFKNDPDYVSADSNIKVYTTEEILSMTKAELKEVLKSRGYTRGMYAPKYQDTLEKLRVKVKRTQSKE